MLNGSYILSPSKKIFMKFQPDLTSVSFFHLFRPIVEKWEFTQKIFRWKVSIRGQNIYEPLKTEIYLYIYMGGSMVQENLFFL